MNATDIVRVLLDESSIQIRHSNEGFDWNGLATQAGVNDAGDAFDCLAAYDGSTMVGSVIYQNTGDFLWIEHIYVTKHYRRSGIGEALLKQAMNENPGLPLEGSWRSPEMEALAAKLRRTGLAD